MLSMLKYPNASSTQDKRDQNITIKQDLSYKYIALLANLDRFFLFLVFLNLFPLDPKGRVLMEVQVTEAHS